MTHLLHYENLTAFKKEYFRDLLSHEHVQGKQINIKKVTYSDGNENDEINFWGYVLEKDGVSYLLSGQNPDGEEVNLRQTLPIRVLESRKVSYRGFAYQLITTYRSMSFRSERKMSFKKLIDTLCSMDHTNPDHQKLMMMIAVASAINRVNFRVATNPGFGKDSSVVTMNSLIGKCGAIVKPTLAKLEYLTHLQWLVISEIVDLKKEDYRDIEQFLLDAGDKKPEFVKHSRAQSKGEEIRDISGLSLGLVYNRISDYPEGKEIYFDFVVKKAILDRFPPLLLHGKFVKQESTNDFNHTLVKENFQFYKDLVYTLMWYSENYLPVGRAPWVRNEKNFPSERWKDNIDKLLVYVDLYSETQEEFSAWERMIYDAIEDYGQMLLYPDYYNKAVKVMSLKEQQQLHIALEQYPTFKSKNDYLRKAVNGESSYKDSEVKWF